MQQKLATRGKDGSEAHKSFGEQFTDSDTYKNLVTRRVGAVAPSSNSRRT